MGNVIFVIEIIVTIFLVLFIPFAIFKLLDIIYEKKYCKSKPVDKPIPGSSYEDWHNLPASEVLGDFSGMKRTTKEWHDKPLTF